MFQTCGRPATAVRPVDLGLLGNSRGLPSFKEQGPAIPAHHVGHTYTYATRAPRPELIPKRCRAARAATRLATASHTFHSIPHRMSHFPAPFPAGLRTWYHHWLPNAAVSSSCKFRISFPPDQEVALPFATAVAPVGRVCQTRCRRSSTLETHSPAPHRCRPSLLDADTDSRAGVPR